MSSKTGGVTRIIHAFGYSCQGLAAAWKHEAAIRQEALMISVLLPLGLWYADTSIERALLALSLLLVPIVELINSSIEAIVDRASPERHELAGRAKDIGSAAVLVALLNAGLIWLLVFYPKVRVALS